MLGEHTVLHGSKAYAVPFRQLKAQLYHVDNPPDSLVVDQVVTDERLNFSAWCAFAKTTAGLAGVLDVERWEAEAESLRVSSSIPIGYGLGSSGAITALLYRRYQQRMLDAPPDWNNLRVILSKLEGFFHGRSSGLDPLVSFCDRGLVIEEGGSTKLSTRDALFPLLVEGGAWFLVDSQQPRGGKDAIARFGESCTDPTWRKEVLAPMIKLVNQLVDQSQQEGSTRDDLLALQRLSELQFQHLHFLIPQHIATLWKELTSKGVAHMKLCGAGGGGYFLGYAPEPEKLTDFPVQFLTP